MSAAIKAHLLEIPGIGEALADQLVAAGLTRISDLKTARYNALLPKMTQLHLKYPTSVISWDTANNFIKCLPDYLTPVGSFRRQVATNGDIDLLTTKPLSTVHADIVALGTGQAERGLTLKRAAFKYIDVYAEGTQKLSIICEYKGKYIAVDIFKTTLAELPYAMLHFTGNARFNIRVRAVAKKKGFKLNQHGLYTTAGNLVTPRAQTEREILDKIGITYLPPQLRSE